MPISKVHNYRSQKLGNVKHLWKLVGHAVMKGRGTDKNSFWHQLQNVRRLFQSPDQSLTTPTSHPLFYLWSQLYSENKSIIEMSKIKNILNWRVTYKAQNQEESGSRNPRGMKIQLPAFISILKPYSHWNVEIQTEEKHVGTSSKAAEVNENTVADFESGHKCSL